MAPVLVLIVPARVAVAEVPPGPLQGPLPLNMLPVCMMIMSHTATGSKVNPFHVPVMSMSAALTTRGTTSVSPATTIRADVIAPTRVRWHRFIVVPFPLSALPFRFAQRLCAATHVQGCFSTESNKGAASRGAPFEWDFRPIRLIAK